MLLQHRHVLHQCIKTFDSTHDLRVWMSCFTAAIHYLLCYVHSIHVKISWINPKAHTLRLQVKHCWDYESLMTLLSPCLLQHFISHPVCMMQILIQHTGWACFNRIRNFNKCRWQDCNWLIYSHVTTTGILTESKLSSIEAIEICNSLNCKLGSINGVTITMNEAQTDKTHTATRDEGNLTSDTRSYSMQ